MKLGKYNFLTAIIIFMVCLPTAVLAKNNPFDKSVSVDIDADNDWLIRDKTATRSGSDSANFYHLFYDKKQLRLRITEGAEDSDASVEQYQHLAIEDVRVDGKRLPLFQWCLGNQQKHSRFLQQGLQVKKGVCKNQGEKGTFILRLNAATLETLKNAQTLSIKIRPFRSSINVNFDISDFSDMVASLMPKAKPVQKQLVQVAAVDKVVALEKCKATPPKGFAKIEAVEYVCVDTSAKAEAEANVEALVTKERKRKAELAAENKRKRQQEVAVKAAKQAEQLANKKAEEELLAAEQTALAKTEVSKQEMSAEITNKMLAICQKKWVVGEHRCYCEKFIDLAPEGIESNPSCR